MSRFVAVCHAAHMSGPARTNEPRLRWLAEHGALRVVVPSEGPAADLFRPFAPVDVLDYEPLSLPGSVPDAVANLRRARRTVALFRRYFRDTEPDLILVMTTYLPAVLLAARLERLRTVVYVAELLDRHHAGGALRRTGFLLTRLWTALLANGLVCNSKATTAQFDRLRRSSVWTTYPGIGVDHSNGDGAGFLQSRGLAGDAWTIGVIGNVTPPRGQDVMVRALPEIRRALPGARCLFAGDPHPRGSDLDYRNDLLDLARELDVVDAVTFVGNVDNMTDMYAACDVVVNPARVHESLGRVALEALASGTPVVATRVGAVPEVLADGRHALLVGPDDPQSLAKAVVRIGTDDELRERLVAEGRAHVRDTFSEAGDLARFREALSGLGLEL